MFWLRVLFGRMRSRWVGAATDMRVPVALRSSLYSLFAWRYGVALEARIRQNEQIWAEWVQPCSEGNEAWLLLINTSRRKFRSQTSNNMDRWKSRGVKSQRIEEKKKEDHKRESFRCFRSKKIQVREKVGKSRNTAFFQWFVAPEGRKVVSPKRRVRSHVARWDEKLPNSPLPASIWASSSGFKPSWGSAGTLGSESNMKLSALISEPPTLTTSCPSTCPNEGKCSSFLCKMGAIWGDERWTSAHRCGAKHISKSNVQNTPGSEHFLRLRCRKSARGSGVKHISKSKCWNHHMFGPLLDVQMSFCVAGARDCAPCQKWAKRDGFVAVSKTMAGVAFRVAGAVQETCSSEMLGDQGADFLRGVAFWSTNSSVLGRWFCMTGAALRMLFRVYFRQMEWKNRKTQWYEAVSSALNFPFLKEVLQNCFVFDVVNFENWGSLADLLRFWHCQVQKLRKSRRIALFSNLQKDRQTASQPGRQTDSRRTDRQTERERETDRQTERER